MSDSGIGTEQLLPFEKGADSPADTHQSLMDVLDSDPDFGDEQPAAKKPSADEGPKPDETEPEDEEPQDEESESEEESDDDEEQEGDEEEGPGPDPLYEAIVDGQAVKVTLKEALAGYQRQQDYTRGKVALAREKEGIQAEVTQLRSVREQEAQMLEALGKALESIAPPKRDWDKLKAENPSQYAVEYADHQRHEADRQAVEREQQRVYEARAADWEKQQEALLEAEKEKLLVAIPEWKDQAKADTEKNRIREWAMATHGYTEQQIRGITDHNLMVVLRKAMLYDEGQTNGKAKIAGKVKPAAPPMKPGSRVPREKVKSGQRRARERLARSGRPEDADAFLEYLLPDD